MALHEPMPRRPPAAEARYLASLSTAALEELDACVALLMGETMRGAQAQRLTRHLRSRQRRGQPPSTLDRAEQIVRQHLQVPPPTNGSPSAPRRPS